MAVYHSPRLGLVINAQPEGPRVQFVDGRYETKDKKEQALIEGSRGFGIHIFKEESAPEPEPEQAKKPAEKPKKTKGKKDKRSEERRVGRERRRTRWPRDWRSDVCSSDL